jgi:signal peptidase I
VIGPFASVEKQMRSNASNWLELGEKVYHYRRDELKDADRAALQQQMETLRALLKERADASKLKLGIESLEGVLRRIGGKIYPKSTLQEYVEFLLVAAIVVLGIRTYFIQPFKIPTNSMWPSYNGMTAQVYPDPSQSPGPLARVARLVTRGAFHKEAIAPVSGAIRIPVDLGSGRVAFRTVAGRKWGVIPDTEREYLFNVGGEEVRLRVPEDFDMEPPAPLASVFREGFGLSSAELAEKARASHDRVGSMAWVTLDKHAERGKPILSFDVLTGDLLFVDRVSYHFMQPKPGDGFVFRTGNIPKLAQFLRPGTPTDQYYIKRLIGVPGDTIEVKPPMIIRNGSPITGAKAFEMNGHRTGLYRGYFNGDPATGATMLFEGQSIKVPEHAFLAMGDNSSNSLDGRFWGYVPAADVVGRPLFVYFPFTSHWGPAR